MGYFKNNLENMSDIWEVSSKKISNYDRNFLPSIATRLRSNKYYNNLSSSSPQVVIKIVSHACGRGQLNSMFKYLSREGSKEELLFEDQNGHSIDSRQNLLNDWQRDFLPKAEYEKQLWKFELLGEMSSEYEKLELRKDREGFLSTEDEDRLNNLSEQISGKYQIKDGKKISLQMTGLKDATHIILSVGGKPDVSKAKIATQGFLQENFSANGFRYIFVTHNDTNNLHFHLVVHNKGMFGNRLYFDKSDLFMLRNQYAKHLSEMGIDRVSTLRKDRVEVIDKIKKGVEILKERNSWYQHKVAKGEGSFNYYKYRSSLLRQTEFMAQNLKRQAKYGVDYPNLAQDIKALRDMKKKLHIVTKDNFGTIQEATLKQLSKDNSKLLKKVENMSQDNFALSPKRKDSMKEFLYNHKADIKDARHYMIKHNKISNDKDRKMFKNTLGQMDKLLKSLKIKELSM